MPRDDDYDSRDDRDDDRPRPRRRRDYNDTPKSGGAGKVILIVALCVGIPLLVCGGIVAYVAYIATQVVAAVTQAAGQFVGGAQATSEANQFLDLLQTAPDLAYEHTTPEYQKATSKEQFKKLLKDNPVLTEPNYHNEGILPTPTGTAPNRKVSLTYTVKHGENPNPTNTTTSTGKTQPTVTKPATPATAPSTAPTPKSVIVTITLTEQPGSTWKVDGFTVQ